MLQKRNLIFLSLLIMSVLLLSSCFLNPPATEGILKGQVMVPEGTIQTKDLTGQALPDATVNIINLETGAIIATATTDANGYYQVFVPAGGPYLLQAIKDGIIVLQITPQAEVGIEYDLGTADCSTTAVALIALAMLDAEDYPDDLADINLTDIEADTDFADVMNPVCSVIEAAGDPTTTSAIQEAVEDFLYPPPPTPTPSPAPTPIPSSAKEITSYQFEADKNGALASDVTGTVDSGAYTVVLTVPYGTTLTALVATFELSASATAKIVDTTQESGTTANDFTSSVTYTVTAENGSTQDWVVTVTVTIGPLDHFTITGYPESTTAGDNFDSNNIVITAYDGNSKIKTDYSGQVYFTSTDGSAILPYTSGGKYTFTAGDNGTHTFPGTGFTLKTAGSQTVTLTDGTVSVISSAITVAAATKNKLLWVTQPASLVLTGATWTTFTIEITDAYGNRTTDTDEVTIAPSSLTLGGTTTQAASGGLATFNNITCSTAGTITITGSSGSLTLTPASDEVTVVNTIVSGKVRDATTTEGISGATVTIESTVFSDTTDSNGDYSFSNVPAGSYSIKASKTDYVDGTESITVVEGQTTIKDIILTPSLTEGKMRIILTWATFDDLDSHLYTPPNDVEFYYGNKGDDTTEAMLDCDDTDGYGPETMTINTLNDGTYTYKVYDFSTVYSTIADCGAVVKLYDHNGLLKTYTPNVGSCPQNSWWTVFTLTVTGGGAVAVNDVNTVP